MTRQLLRLADWKFFVVIAVSAGALPGHADDAFKAPPIAVLGGYTIELAAAPPLVKHPMMAGFDDRGRLFVAEAAGENLRRPDLEKQLPNFVRMLEDTNGDGVFDKSTIFVDKMTFPMGALWHEGALFVASSGGIWRFEDTDDDGVADLRTKIVSDFGYSGNAADVHGCFLGPCGRIYWCEGRHGHEFRNQTGDITSAGKAARIFSCQPDGSDIQVHCGGGMDNPVEIDFLPTGEMLGTVNIMFRQRGDCLVHWMRGGVYPRHDQPKVVDEFRRTGELLSPVHNFGHVAVSGMTRYRGTHLGESFRGNLFVTEFNTHKVKRVRLQREGSTFVAEAEDFITSSFGDFHPTDVLEDADGSLLVIDTGGWFRIGCPTSQIAKPNVLGAIYRIRRKGVTVEDPRGNDIVWHTQTVAQITDLMVDERTVVRDRALTELVRDGNASIGILSTLLANSKDSKGYDEQRVLPVWGLARIGSERARVVLRKQIRHEVSSIRLAATTALGILRDQAAVPALCELLVDDDHAIRREAATTLGRIGAASAVDPLLDALRGQVNRVEEHAMIFALIEINQPVATAKRLASINPRVRRAALIALDQMASQPLTREMVAGLMGTDDLDLRNTSLEIVARHPTWGDEIVQVVGRMLNSVQLSSADQAVLSGSLLAFEKNQAIQQLVAKSLADKATPTVRKRQILEVIAQTALGELPTDWGTQIRVILEMDDPLLIEQAVKTIAAIKLPRVEQQLQRIANDPTRPLDLRIAALDVLSHRGEVLAANHFRLLTDQLEADVAPLRRLSAARCIAAASLSSEQVDAVTQLIGRAGALELPALLGAFEDKEYDDRVGKALALALVKSPGLASVSVDRMRALLGLYSDDVRVAAEPLLAKLTTTTANQSRRLTRLQRLLRNGDPEEGKHLFHSRRAACYACHQVQGQGGKIGPDLSTIGGRRNDRDLIEAIVYPSSSLARGFEGFTLVTTDGKVVSGLITRETARAVFVRTADQSEVRVLRDAIEEMQPNGVSIMPAGLDQNMSVDELRDLLAYLRSLK
jgi:putative membrane-bound dehydrogenase-like protein